MRLAIDQKLNVVDIRQAPDAGGIEPNLVVTESDGRFAHVREKLSANHLKLIQTERMIFLNRFIARRDDRQRIVRQSPCCTFKGHRYVTGHPSAPKIIAVHTAHPPVVSNRLIPAR